AQQFLAGYRTSRPLGEIAQDLELAMREVELAPGAPRLQPSQVDKELAEPDLLDGRAYPAQHGIDPRHELVDVKRLRHVVVRAKLESADLVGLLAPRRQHDQRSPSPLSQHATQRESVASRQHEIEQYQVRR